MATFAFQMVAALSERSFGQGGVLMPQTLRFFIKYFGDFRSIMRLNTRWSNLPLLGLKQSKTKGCYT